VVTILKKYYCPFWFHPFVGFAYQGKDIVFGFPPFLGALVLKKIEWQGFII
jgi:hypothetical protein